MASFDAKFIRKCQVIENRVFYLGKKKTKNQKTLFKKIYKMLYFDIAAKKRFLIFPLMKYFFIL